jgi:membrane-associated protease RseP (regulator of RpoE activity)
MEILIALRGRGFLGIGLNEESAPTEEDADDDAPQFVRAIQILDFKTFNHLGVRRPFPADAAGVQVGDKILEVNGRAIRGTKDLMREVILIGPARMASLLIERDGNPLRIVLRLTRNPILAVSSGFGVEQVPDQGPPVDLEKELNLDDKPSAATEKDVGVAAVPAAREESAKDEK